MGITSIPLDVLSDASVPYRPEEPFIMKIWLSISRKEMESEHRKSQNLWRHLLACASFVHNTETIRTTMGFV